MRRASASSRSTPCAAACARCTLLPTGAFEVLVKGSPEAVLEACASFDEEGRPVAMRPEVAAAVLRGRRAARRRRAPGAWPSRDARPTRCRPAARTAEEGLELPRPDRDGRPGASGGARRAAALAGRPASAC